MIFFIGSPLIDMIAHVNKEFLDKYHLNPDDTVRATPKLESIFKELIKFNPIINLGGSVVNSARLFQWISRKSYPVVISGCIGTDEYGKHIREKLVEEEIQCELFEIQDVSTGTVAVLLTEQNRSMVTHLGASKCFSMKHLDDNLWDLLSQSDYFYFSAFSLGTCYEVIQKMCEHFNKRHKTVIMNLGASFLCEGFPNEFIYLVDNADIIFGNEDEYRALHKINSPVQEMTDKELLKKLNTIYIKKPCRILVMTRGNQPLYVFHDGKLEEFEVVPIEKDRVVDTDGAGDAFVAGFLAQHVKGKGIQECVRCGLWTASEIVQQHGCNFDQNKVYKS